MSGESQHQFAWGTPGVLQQEGEPGQEQRTRLGFPCKQKGFPLRESHLRAGTGPPDPSWPPRKGSSASGSVKSVSTSGRSCCLLPPLRNRSGSQVSSSAQVCSWGRCCYVGESCTSWSFPLLDSLCLGVSGGCRHHPSEEPQLPRVYRARDIAGNQVCPWLFAVSFHCLPSS